MKNIIIVALFLLVYVVAMPTNVSAEQTRTQQLVVIVDALYQETLRANTEAYHHSYQEFSEDVRGTVVNTLVHIQDAELLGSLAILAWTIAFPGNDGAFDELFLQTYQTCIKKLAETPSLENYQILKTINCHLCLDGGDSLLFQEMLLRNFGQYVNATDITFTVSDPAQREHRQKAEDNHHWYTPAEIQKIIDRLDLEEVDPNAPPDPLSSSETSGEPSKQARIEELITILEILSQQAVDTQLNEYTETAIQETIEQIMARVHEPEQLGRLAGMTWLLYAFEDTRPIQFKMVFYHTYRGCLEKLAANPNQETYSQLSLLSQCRLCLEGEEQAFFEHTLKSVIQHLKEAGEWPVK